MSADKIATFKFWMVLVIMTKVEDQEMSLRLKEFASLYKRCL